MLQEAKQVDAEVARINSTAPNGESDRLLTVECAARQVNGVADNFSLMNIKLPAFDAPGQWLWPPPVSPILPEQVLPPDSIRTREQIGTRNCNSAMLAASRKPSGWRIITATSNVNGKNVKPPWHGGRRRPEFASRPRGHWAGPPAAQVAEITAQMPAVEQLTPFRRGRYALVARLHGKPRRRISRRLPMTFTAGRCQSAGAPQATAHSRWPFANPSTARPAQQQAGSGLLTPCNPSPPNFLVFISLAKGSKDDTSATAFWVKDGREARRLRTQQHASPVRMT